MTWFVEEERALRGYAVEWVAPGETIVSRREMLYRVTGDITPGDPPGATFGASVVFEPIAQCIAPTWKQWASRARPAQRLLRHMVYNVVKLHDGSLFVTFAKSVGLVRDGHTPNSPDSSVHAACYVAPSV